LNYEDLGLQPIINASSAVTRLGGAPMPQQVLDAFCAAAEECVSLEMLQAAACRKIAEATGTEAGLVTAGSAAGLTLGAAAILAGYNLGRMERLPHCDDFPCEFVVAREHRSGYDHAVRAAGVRFVEVGFNEMVSNAGVRRTEPWEYEAAFGPNTAGVLYVYIPGGKPSLTEVVAIAHKHGIPVLVDAAGEIPPKCNLIDIPAAGADLVSFSGGKGVRGPQSTGILCGRKDLISSAALQMLDMDDHFELWNPPAELIDKSKLDGIPRHGIGRGLKVSKEEIVALLTALDLFVSGAYDSEVETQKGNLTTIAESLSSAPVKCELIESKNGESQPSLEIALDENQLGKTAFEVCEKLRNGTPAVYVSHGKLSEGKLVIMPLWLNDERTAGLIQRLNEELS